MQENNSQKGHQMKEVKILHIHDGKDEVSSFIEFIVLENGKQHVLSYPSFIKRYEQQLIQEFRLAE